MNAEPIVRTEFEKKVEQLKEVAQILGGYTTKLPVLDGNPAMEQGLKRLVAAIKDAEAAMHIIDDGVQQATQKSAGK